MGVWPTARQALPLRACRHSNHRGSAQRCALVQGSNRARKWANLHVLFNLCRFWVVELIVGVRRRSHAGYCACRFNRGDTLSARVTRNLPPCAHI